jgi:Major Facilitator Superfamily
MTSDLEGPRTGSEIATQCSVLSWALAAVCLGYFMVILDTTIVNVALPAMRADLHADVSGLQWVVDAYLLMLAALLLTGGVLADRFGARLVCQVGLGVLCKGSERLSPYRRRWHCCVPPIQRLAPGLGRSESGAGSPASQPPRARSWAVCLSRRPAGGWCSWSTCRSVSRRSC